MKHVPATLAAFFVLAMSLPCTAQDSFCPEPKAVAGPQVKARMGSWKSQNRVDEREAVYNPPPGCFIFDCRARVLSSFGNTSYSVNGLAAGSSFINQQQLDETYEWAVDFAANLAAQGGNGGAVAQLEGALAQQREHHRQFLSALQSSHQACHLSAAARGRGSFVDKGSSIVLTADVDLCCGISELQTVEGLKSFLEGLLNEEYANIAPSSSGTSACGQPTMRCESCDLSAPCTAAGGDPCDQQATRCNSCTVVFECSEPSGGYF